MKIYFMQLIVVLSLVGCSSEEVTIGVVAPLSGGYAEFGQSIVNAISLAAEDYNFTIVIEDEGDCEGKKAAINAVRKLINVDGVDGIVGPLCLGNFQAALPIALEEGVPLFGEAVTQNNVNSDGLTPEYDAIAIGAFPAPKIWERLAQEALKISDEITIISIIDPAAENNVNSFIKEYEKSGTVVKHYKISSGADYRTILTNLNTKLVWPHLTNTNRAQFYKQKEELGVEVIVLGDLWMEIDPSDYIALLGVSYLNGTISTSFKSTTSPEFTKRFLEEFDSPVMLSVDIAYDLAARSSELFKECSTTKCVLEGFRGGEYNGVSGDMIFDENNLRSGETVVKTYVNGVFE